MNDLKTKNFIEPVVLQYYSINVNCITTILDYYYYLFVNQSNNYSFVSENLSGSDRILEFLLILVTLRCPAFLLILPCTSRI